MQAEFICILFIWFYLCSCILECLFSHILTQKQLTMATIYKYYFLKSEDPTKPQQVLKRSLTIAYKIVKWKYLIWTRFSPFNPYSKQLKIPDNRLNKLNFKQLHFCLSFNNCFCSSRKKRRNHREKISSHIPPWMMSHGICANWKPSWHPLWGPQGVCWQKHILHSHHGWECGSKGQPAVNHPGFILTSFSVVTEFVIQRKCGIDISASGMNKSIMACALEWGMGE